MITEVDTFWVQIWVGSRMGYQLDIYSQIESKVYDLVDEYIKDYPICVSVTPTHFRYPKTRPSPDSQLTVRGESGVCVGLINYPRFPKSPEYLTDTALDLAEYLRVNLKQHRVTVVTPTKTYTIGEL